MGRAEAVPGKLEFQMITPLPAFGRVSTVLERVRYAESETTSFQIAKPETPDSLQGFCSEHRRMPELPRTKAFPPGMSELRVL